MKFKLFRLFFLILIAFATSVILINRYYLSQQLKKITKIELETIASTLIASNLSISVLNKFEATDDIIRDLLDQQRLDRTIRIFNSAGQIVFANDLAHNIEQPASPDGWSDISVNGHQLRRLTISHTNYTLEVGLFLDSEVQQMQAELNQVVVLLLIVLLLSLLFAYFATQTTIRPLHQLGTFFVNYNQRHATHAEVYKLADDDRLALQKLSLSDTEVAQLAKSLLSFLEKSSNERSRKERELFLLAHELKMPLSHIFIELEKLSAETKDEALQKKISYLLLLNKNLSSFIQNYLRVASVQSATTETLQLSASRLDQLIEAYMTTLPSHVRIRIRLSVMESTVVLSETHHLESLISNLIANALKYSETDIKIVVDKSSFTVTDYGPGFSPTALENMGKPFNRSSLSESTGLGLTYCFEIARLYGWKIHHSRINDTTTMTVQFNEESLFT